MLHERQKTWRCLQCFLVPSHTACSQLLGLLTWFQKPLSFLSHNPSLPQDHPLSHCTREILAKVPTLPYLSILIILMLRCHLQYNNTPNFLYMSFWPRSQHPVSSSVFLPSILDTSLAFWSLLPLSTTQVTGEAPSLCAILPRALEECGLMTLRVQSSRFQKYDRINSSGFESCNQERHHEKKFGLSMRPSHMTHNRDSTCGKKI